MVLFHGVCFLEAGLTGRITCGTPTSTPVEGLTENTGAHRLMNECKPEIRFKVRDTSGIHIKMGALGSAAWLKTSFLTCVKCASNMSVRYFDSMLFVCCLYFNHLVSTFIPPEKGETATSTAEIYAVYMTALHPTVRSQHCTPGAEFGSEHHHVRGDQTQPLHLKGPHFSLSWQLKYICEKHK